APAEPSFVLRCGVLRVVQEKVGTCRERPAGDPFGLIVQRGGQVRLMVRHVGEHMTLLLDPVAEGGPTMLDRLGLDHRASHAPGPAWHVFERGLGGGFREADREERRRQVSRDPLPQRRGRGRWPPEPEPPAGRPERREEAEPFHVVEMEVGEADVELAVISLEQPLPELADPGARIEDQRGAVGELELDTGGVAAVADGRGSRRGERAARAPNADDHGAAESSQKIDMAPTTSSGREKSGKAVTVISCSRPSRPRIANESWT